LNTATYNDCLCESEEYILFDTDLGGSSLTSKSCDTCASGKLVVTEDVMIGSLSPFKFLF